MFQRFIRSLRYRYIWSRIGVPFIRCKGERLSQLRIAGTDIFLCFPDSERRILEHELTLMYWEDCYWLTASRPTPNVVVDVGGNVGLFSMIARHYFPKARIVCYEPNEVLSPSLNMHLAPLGVEIILEAVGSRAGRVALRMGENSLHTQVFTQGEATVPMVSFDKVVERCGGTVDLLKLDCEGAEWEILEHSEAIDSVKEIVMEYHLWAQSNSTYNVLYKLLLSRGFVVKEHRHSLGDSWGLVRATR